MHGTTSGEFAPVQCGEFAPVQLFIFATLFEYEFMHRG